MLNCRQFLGELSEYLDGTQASGHFADIERHLCACRKCRIVCETTRQTLGLYRRAWSRCVLPADVESRLMAALGKRLDSRE